MKPFDKDQMSGTHSDKEINDVAEWLQSLTFEELLVLKRLDESVKEAANVFLDGVYVH